MVPKDPASMRQPRALYASCELVYSYKHCQLAWLARATFRIPPCANGGQCSVGFWGPSHALAFAASQRTPGNFHATRLRPEPKARFTEAYDYGSHADVQLHIAGPQGRQQVFCTLPSLTHGARCIVDPRLELSAAVMDCIHMQQHHALQKWTRTSAPCPKRLAP